MIQTKLLLLCDTPSIMSKSTIFPTDELRVFKVLLTDYATLCVSFGGFGITDPTSELHSDSESEIIAFYNCFLLEVYEFFFIWFILLSSLEE